MSIGDKLNIIINEENAMKNAILNKGYSTAPTFNNINTTIENLEYTPDVMSFYQSAAQEIDFDRINLSNINLYAHMFFNCRYLTHIYNFNTNNVYRPINMFSGCTNLTSIPNFNYANGSIYSIFSECRKITSVPNFDTSDVTNVVRAFRNCSYLTSIPNYNLYNVNNMQYTFYKCSNLTTVPNFDTSNIICMIRHIFRMY